MNAHKHNHLNWLHVYYVCRYFIFLYMDLIIQTRAKQSESLKQSQQKKKKKKDERGMWIVASMVSSLDDNFLLAILRIFSFY